MARPRVLHRPRRRAPRGYGYRAVGGLPLAPAQIPVIWFSDPLSLRLVRPATHAEVTQNDGVVARADAAGATVVVPFTATLFTGCDADPANLAHWVITYQAQARMTSPSLVIDLLYRTDAERIYLLGIGRNRRIQILGLPPQWPAGADSLVVRGIHHELGTQVRRIQWVTSPIVGLVAGVPGPWFRRGSSSRGGTDIRPF